MKPSLLPYVLLALATGSAFSADPSQPPAEEARQWLERMVQATRNLNNEGTFIFVQGPHMEAMRIVHGGGENNERQRLVSLTGPAREILVTRNGVISLLPKQHAKFLGSEYRDSRFPLSLPGELDKLKNRYDFEMLGEDRAAGMAAQVVAIKPKDALRYGYRLWLDQQNGLLLRSALLDDKGYPIEQLMFTDLQIKQQIDEDTFKPPALVGEPESPAIPPSAEGAKPPAGVPMTRSAWSVTQVPEGFVKILHNRFTEASGRHSTEHMVFADGLATVSVFVERLDGTTPLLQGESQLGSMNACGIKLDDYQILVVGEVPAITVKSIASSISYDAEVAKDLAKENKP